uniref:Uncharacterized protein n=1 Tax=Rhizophora mucronata TaxID=61149 RepID=A0A2P2MTG4_RHIMU
MWLGGVSVRVKAKQSQDRLIW